MDNQTQQDKATIKLIASLLGALIGLALVLMVIVSMIT